MRSSRKRNIWEPPVGQEAPAQRGTSWETHQPHPGVGKGNPSPQPGGKGRVVLDHVGATFTLI